MANPSQLFIVRPIATSLLMLALLLTGALAYHFLPVSALPEIDYPTIQVVTKYPGAGPEVITSGITAPLEQQFGQMAGLKQMNSQSSAEASVITLQFSLDLSLDVAEQQVQAAINAATGFLPLDLPDPPIYNKVNPADPPIMTLAVTAANMPLYALEDLLTARFIQKLSQVSGVGLVSIAGGQKPAMRIQADPYLLASFNLCLEDLRLAVLNANVNIAKGSFDGPERSVTINANDQLQTVDEFKALIIGYYNNAPIRLADVADVTQGPENQRLAAWYNEQPSIIINIQRQPGANIITVADEIKQLLPSLQKNLPASVQSHVLSDRTITTRATIADVQFELFFAVGLVLAVMFLFLRNARAALIPGVAVPLSLIGSFAVMYALGYSINNLTLMAMTIATGFVIDDAIVVTENISRYLEQGFSPLKAALKGSEQIAFTIISLTISLVAVLIPLLFMTDVVGRLFREFAVTLAASILLSALISLTLTPMMCAYLLKPFTQAHQQTTSFFWQKILGFYDYSLHIIFNHQKLVLAIFGLTFLLTVWLYFFIPKGFFPIQDTGMIQGIIEAREDVGFQAMVKKQRAVARSVLQDPDVASLSSFIGVDGLNPTLNTGRINITLKPLAERQSRVEEIILRLKNNLQHLPGLTVYLQATQDITIEDKISKSQYQFVLEALTKEQLFQWGPHFLHALKTIPSLDNVASDLQRAGKELHIEIDRDQAARLGISVAAIDAALYNAFGQRMISTIFTQTSQYRVILEVKKAYRNNPKSLDGVYLSSVNGTLVPLSNIVHVKEQKTPLLIARHGQFPACTISFNLSPGASLGEAVTAIQKTAQNIQLPTEMQINFQGAAKAFTSSLNNTLWLILAAILTVYIVLGILYEHFIHPITIFSTLPSAGVGALLALELFKMDLGIVGIIGIILLIGIVKKNAILMVDFALEAERKKNKPPLEAIHQACLLRLRPILMTTFAAMLGALPLVLGGGMGSELRRPLGVTMIGGLLFSQILTLYTTPVIYLTFERFSRWQQKILKLS